VKKQGDERSERINSLSKRDVEGYIWKTEMRLVEGGCVKSRKWAT
jgi:hypothetical protein